MAKWTEIEFADALYMATNPNYPGKKAAKRLLNVHTHQKPGHIMLRPGYELKYDDPTDTKLSNTSSLNFDMFFDRQTNPNGQEITVLLQKGTVTSFDAGGPTGDKIDMLCFWARPFWNGNTWVDEWEWLNETIVTKVVTGSDSTYKNAITIVNNGVAEDALIGYTIYNKTKNIYAKIITNKTVTAEVMRINHTSFDGVWSADDEIVISKAWIDLNSLNALYNIAYNDVVFHRILNDIRIGFGGYENRPGIAIGYRKKFFLIKEISFTDIHPDLTEEAIEKFSSIDELVLDTNILNTDGAGIELSTAAGILAAKTYYFRLTGVMDGYAEQFIAKANIEVDGTQDILAKPYLDMGKINPRITKTKLYYSEDNLTFYKIREDIISSGVREFLTLNIDENNRLNGEAFSIQGDGEYHRDENAANVTNEANSTGQWSNKGGSSTFILSLPQFLRLGGSYIPAADGGQYIHWESGSTVTSMNLFSPMIKAEKTRLEVSFKIITTNNIILRVSSGFSDIPDPFGEEREYKDLEINNLVNWETHTFEIDIQGSLTFRVINGNTSSIRIGIDGLTVVNTDPSTVQLGTEMRDEMGYNPTLNLVKGWDQALKLSGRMYYLNPYVEKRYENFLLVSHIAPPSVFMWDIASFSNFRELERYDSNSAVGMALLPTMEIIIMKDRSFEIIADDGIVGIPREPILDVSCISRDTIQNILGAIYCCGEEDIYVFTVSRGVTGILKETIRDIYQSIDNKKDLFAIRDEHNTYRLRLPDKIDKTEFLFTEHGPVEEIKHLFPEVYRIGKGGMMHFLSSGKIYHLEAQLAGVLLDDVGSYITDDDDSYLVDG